MFKLQVVIIPQSLASSDLNLSSSIGTPNPVLSLTTDKLDENNDHRYNQQSAPLFDHNTSYAMNVMSTPMYLNRPQYSNNFSHPFINYNNNTNGNNKRIKKFLHITSANNPLSIVAQEINQRFLKLYPDGEPLQILKIQNIEECDLDPDYTVSMVFDTSNICRVIVANEFDDDDTSMLINGKRHLTGDLNKVMKKRRNNSSKTTINHDDSIINTSIWAFDDNNNNHNDNAGNSTSNRHRNKQLMNKPIGMTQPSENPNISSAIPDVDDTVIHPAKKGNLKLASPILATGSPTRITSGMLTVNSQPNLSKVDYEEDINGSMYYENENERGSVPAKSDSPKSKSSKKSTNKKSNDILKNLDTNKDLPVMDDVETPNTSVLVMKTPENKKTSLPSMSSVPNPSDKEQAKKENLDNSTPNKKAAKVATPKKKKSEKEKETESQPPALSEKEKEEKAVKLAKEKEEKAAKAAQLAKEKEEKAFKLAKEKEEKTAKLAKEKEEKALKLAKEKEEKAAKLAKEKEERAAKAAKLVKEKEEKAAKLAKEKEEKAAKLAKEKEEKAAKLAKEKEEKAAKLAKEKEEKAAKLAQEKEEKAAKLLQEKALKAAELAKEKAEKALKAVDSTKEDSIAKPVENATKKATNAKSDDKVTNDTSKKFSEKPVENKDTSKKTAEKPIEASKPLDKDALKELAEQKAKAQIEKITNNLMAKAATSSQSKTNETVKSTPDNKKRSANEIKETTETPSKKTKKAVTTKESNTVTNRNKGPTSVRSDDEDADVTAIRKLTTDATPDEDIHPHPTKPVKIQKITVGGSQTSYVSSQNKETPKVTTRSKNTAKEVVALSDEDSATDLDSDSDSDDASAKPAVVTAPTTIRKPKPSVKPAAKATSKPTTTEKESASVANNKTAKPTETANKAKEPVNAPTTGSQSRLSSLPSLSTIFDKKLPETRLKKTQPKKPEVIDSESSESSDSSSGSDSSDSDSDTGSDSDSGNAKFINAKSAGKFISSKSSKSKGKKNKAFSALMKDSKK